MGSNSVSHGGSATTITAVHQSIIETHILTRFDGPSLASTASTSHLLQTLCNDDTLWEDLCTSTWTSIKHPLVRQAISTFPGGYRAFFSDSFPLLRPNPSEGSFNIGQAHSSQLISAVDVYYGDDQVYSKVKATNTDNSSFLGLQFCIDLLDGVETAKMPAKYEDDENKCMSDLEENLRLSWIVIDPKLKRAAKVSSLRPISVRPCWDGSGVKVKCATIVSGDNQGIYTTEFVECRVLAIFCFEGENLKLKELSLCVVDMDWTRLNGEKSLRVLGEALRSGLRKRASGEEEKEMYAKYVASKRKKRDEVKKENIVHRVLWFTHGMIWIFFVFSLITSLYYTLN